MVSCIFNIWSILDHAEEHSSIAKLLTRGFQLQQISKAWNAVTLCVFWTIWQE